MGPLPKVSDRPRFVANVAALASITGIRNGDLAQTASCRTDGDNGGTVFQYRSTGRSGVTTSTYGWYINGPGADDYYEATDKSVADIRQFGALTYAQDNSHDAVAPIVAACEAALASGGSVRIPSSGSSYYRLASGDTVSLTSDLTVAVEGATFVSDHAGATTLIFESAASATPAYDQASSDRGDTTIDVDDATGINVGDLVHISSDIIWVTGRDYTKQELHRVGSISGNTLTLTEPLVFSYDTAGTPTEDTVAINVYPARKLTIKGSLSIQSNQGTGKRVLDLRNLTNSSIENIDLINSDHDRASGPDPLMLNRCWAPIVRGVKIEGGRYGINITNATRGARIYDVDASYCWHPIDPNTTAYDTEIHNLRGFANDTTVQCHETFLTSYYRVRCEEGFGYLWRSVGGTLEDVRITSSSDAIVDSYTALTFNTASSSVDDLHPYYEKVYDGFRVSYPNEESSDAAATVDANGVMVVRNCSVAGIRAGSTGTSQVTIENTECQYARIRGASARVSNVRFNQAFPGLHSSLRDDTAWNGNGVSEVVMVGAEFYGGYDYVVDELPSGCDYQFTGCRFKDIGTDFTGTGSANSGSMTVNITGSTFDDCTIPISARQGIGWLSQGNTIIGSGVIFAPGELTYAAASPTIRTYANAAIDSSSNAVNGTLGAGKYVGHRITIRMTDASNSSTVSVTNHETSNPEVFTFAATTAYLILEWDGSRWLTIKATATT